jgi:hypothetical protein
MATDKDVAAARIRDFLMDECPPGLISADDMVVTETTLGLARPLASLYTGSM